MNVNFEKKHLKVLDKISWYYGSQFILGAKSKINYREYVDPTFQNNADLLIPVHTVSKLRKIYKQLQKCPPKSQNILAAYGNQIDNYNANIRLAYTFDNIQYAWILDYYPNPSKSIIQAAKIYLYSALTDFMEIK